MSGYPGGAHMLKCVSLAITRGYANTHKGLQPLKCIRSTQLGKTNDYARLVVNAALSFDAALPGRAWASPRNWQRHLRQALECEPLCWHDGVRRDAL